MAGLLYYLYPVIDSPYIWAGLTFLSCLTGLMLLLIFFQIDRAHRLLPSKQWTFHIKKYLSVFSKYTTSGLAMTLGFSGARYVVFSVQFLMMLQIFGVEVGAFQGFMLICLYYLIQTAIPGNLLTEFGVRGAVSVFIFENYTDRESAILAATYGIWAINLLFPAMSGLLILLFRKIRLGKSWA